MTKAELIAAVAGEAQVRKVDAEKAINSLIRIVSETLKKSGPLGVGGVRHLFRVGTEGP